MTFEKLEKKIGISFKNKDLLKQAFTHRSYLNENRHIDFGHNERLEFLGDAVLELVTTDFLYNKYPNRNEGELTALRSALVNTNAIAEVSTELEFNEHLMLSKGEKKDVGRARQYILANTFEAVVGAIYMDQGYDAANKFISDFLLPKIDGIVAEGTWIDAKSKLQEKVQEIFSVTPSYNTIKETGPDHDKTFVVEVDYGNGRTMDGSGKSKQEAEQEAARNTLMHEGWM